MCEYAECVREVVTVEETVHLVKGGSEIMVVRPYWDAIQVSEEERDAFWGELDPKEWRVSRSTWSEERRCFAEDGWDLGGTSTPIDAPTLPFRPSVGTPHGWSVISSPEL